MARLYRIGQELKLLKIKLLEETFVIKPGNKFTQSGDVVQGILHDVHLFACSNFINRFAKLKDETVRDNCSQPKAQNNNTGHIELKIHCSRDKVICSSLHFCK